MILWLSNLDNMNPNLLQLERTFLWSFYATVRDLIISRYWRLLQILSEVKAGTAFKSYRYPSSGELFGKGWGTRLAGGARYVTAALSHINGDLNRNRATVTGSPRQLLLLPKSTRKLHSQACVQPWDSPEFSLTSLSTATTKAGLSWR